MLNSTLTMHSETTMSFSTDRTRAIPEIWHLEPSLNQTLCIYMKQYSLGERVYATVCTIDGEIILEVNGSATVLGL